MLTLEKLKSFGDNEIFLRGEVIDSPDGINMSNSEKQLRWVAVAGNGFHDWTIYYHFAENDWEYITRSGDKLCGKENIKKLVSCDDEAFQMYRI